MIKIALLVPSVFVGGGVPSVARFIVDVAKAEGYEVIIVSPSVDARDPHGRCLSRPKTWFRKTLLRRSEWYGITTYIVGANLPEFEFQRYMPRKCITDLLNSCDVVQVISGSPAWGNITRNVKPPVSLQVATRTKVERRAKHKAEHGFFNAWRKLMTVIIDEIDDVVLKEVDAIQVENYWMFEYVKSIRRSASGLTFSPPGVDAAKFFPSDNRAEQMYSGEVYILCVGRFADPRKNINLLLPTLHKLNIDRFPERVKVVLAGSSCPSDFFWQMAEELGVAEDIQFIFSPTDEQLQLLYRNAALFVLPSDEEGLGIVLLEAMASGIPVVSTRSGGPEGIISHGTTGFLVDRDDSASMATYLKLLLDDVRLNLHIGVAARAHIMGRFDKHSTGVAFSKIWKDLLSD